MKCNFVQEMFFAIFAILIKKMVVVAQLVRASDCDSEGRGFEPPRLPTLKKSCTLQDFFILQIPVTLVARSEK